MDESDYFNNDEDDDIYLQGIEEAEKSLKSESLRGEKPSTSNLNADTGFFRNSLKISTESTTKPASALQCLRRYFGHADFRPHQWEIISSLLYDKRDQCIIMATGSGKSLCYQFPSLLVGGVTVVISPLISLMEDQVQALNLAGIEACLLGSAQKDFTVRGRVLKGLFKIVYLTPEFVEADVGYTLLDQISSLVGLTLIAIDEAHCISQWGHEFRSSYRKLGDLRRRFSKIPFMALTATATPQVQRDIVENLHLFSPLVTVTSFNRANLFFEVFPKEHGIAGDVKRFMKQNDDGSFCFKGSTIIYCPTRRQAEEVCRVLDGMGANVELYHAGLSLKLRTEAHKKFTNDECEVIVATVAFGMGIDKPDVRRVIHYGAPKDIESYYQEIGRAGRDGMPSVCSVVYSNGDFMVYNHFLNDVKSPKFREHKQNMQKKMQQLLVGSSCRRSMLLAHFEGAQTKPSETGTDACCDNCRRQLATAAKRQNRTTVATTRQNIGEEKDYGGEAWIMFQTIQAIRGRYGLTILVHVIRGSQEKKVPDFVKTHKIFGAGNSKPDKWWKAFAVALKLEGYLVEKPVPNGFGNTIGLSDKALLWLRLKEKNEQSSFLLTPTSEIINVEAEEEEKFRKRIYREQKDDVVPVPVVSNDKKIKFRGNLPVKRETKIVDAPPQANVANLALEGLLMNKLTNLRTKMARDSDVPPYLVATNRALFEMARIRPTCLESLGKVEDFPEARVKKFGSAFVQCIQQFCDEHKELSTNFIANTTNVPPMEKETATSEKETVISEKEMVPSVKRTLSAETDGSKRKLPSWMGNAAGKKTKSSIFK